MKDTEIADIKFNFWHENCWYQVIKAKLRERGGLEENTLRPDSWSLSGSGYRSQI